MLLRLRLLLFACFGAATPPTHWTTGALDDAAFPPEEYSTLAAIHMPTFSSANVSAGTATLINPEDGLPFELATGTTNLDFTLVAVLSHPLRVVLERNFIRFGIIVYLMPNAQQPLVLRKAVGILETVQTQAISFYTETYYSSFALERVLRQTHGEPTYESVLPLLSPMASYLTLGSIGEGHKFTMCPDGVIKLANGTLREPPAQGGAGSVVFDPATHGRMPAARYYTDSVGGTLGGFLPAASFGFSNSDTGDAWEINAFVMPYAARDEPHALLVRLARLGGVVQYFAVGASAVEGPLEPTAAALTFFGELFALHELFARYLLPPRAASVTLPYHERRLVETSHGGMAQALATFDGLSQRYGTGIDYFVGTKELMVIATTVNAALLAWGVETDPSAASANTTLPGAAAARLTSYLAEYVNATDGTFRFHTARCG